MAPHRVVAGGELFRFAAVGGLATLVHFAVAWMVLMLWPGMTPFLANLIAFLVAFNISWIGHRFYTFSRAGCFWRFFLVTIVGFSLNNVFLAIAVSLDVMSSFLSIVVSNLAVPLVVFSLNRIFVFVRA